MRTQQSLRMLLLMSVALCAPDVHATAATPKRHSVFYPVQLLERAQRNIQQYAWAKQIRDGIVQDAEPWRKLSDEQLWHLMFGPTIPRSWMVWSDGHCPACQQPVPMYNWRMKAMQRPWKTQCPHCQEWFPKNDFRQFYLSGLDEHGIFEPDQADRSLLFNVEHPDPQDPLHHFGVDDGQGYVDGNKRWRFIGAYLVYGQWKQAVLGGIKRLAAAYVVTGDRCYAHKAAILLDRVADLYPTFDFRQQALLYERVRGNGYVSVWHDACEETRELALAYDQIFSGMDGDGPLVEFLSAKAREFKTPNQKHNIGDIRFNIESRILHDALQNSAKIHSNYPRTPIAVAVMRAILDWPENREEVLSIIDGLLAKATAVDGVTGEKGLANYAAYGPQSIALFLAEWDRAIPGFLDEVYRRQPRIRDLFRFHIDTWCLLHYYPLSGDTGWFARRIDQYQGVRFVRPDRTSGYSHSDTSLAPSMFTFMWRLYQLTEDPAFVQVLFQANEGRTEGLPYDLFAARQSELRTGVERVVAKLGGMPQLGSVNKPAWHLGILRSGEGDEARAAWLDYDSGGGHGHADGMNLGLFAKGLDLMPDFGYPPVQFGGWNSPKATWYRMTAAHNTVVVDGQNLPAASGKTSLWADGQTVRAIRAAAPGMNGGKNYERTIALVDVDASAFYLVDIFGVVGGHEHAKFMHSHFGTITTEGLQLNEAEPWGSGTQMRNFRTDPRAVPGWSVTWEIDDRYQNLPSDGQVRLRYTDLTWGAEASTAEGWITMGQYDSSEQTWIPRVMVRRHTDTAPLVSTFVSIVEPYERQSSIVSMRRFDLDTRDGIQSPDSHVAVEIQLRDGHRDLIVAADVAHRLGSDPATAAETAALQIPEVQLELRGEMCFVRTNANRQLERIALANVNALKIHNWQFQCDVAAPFVELSRDTNGWQVVTGDADSVQISDVSP
jgi:hypothetical protein